MSKLLSTFGRRFWNANRDIGRIDAENIERIGIARGLFADDNELVWG